MFATYAAAAMVCVSALAIGQAALALCGVRRWSWLSPAVGLALLCAVCWATVRLPGDGLLSALAVAALTVAAIVLLRGRLEEGGEALRLGWPAAVIALAAASVPFLRAGHFGILGTGFNPDMSQHLLAADSLAQGHGSELLSQGYPLGPHAIVVALHKGLGVGLVQGFDGLTMAVAVLAALTALAAFDRLPRPARVAGALGVALTYMVASYYAQGAFKETMEALFVLAFVLALREAGRDSEHRDLTLRLVPAALLAVGAVYVYSYPGLVWLAGIAGLWAVGSRLFAPPALGRSPLRAALLAALLLLVLVAPEIGRMIEFSNFETFDPNGPGLGNLFGQISPFEALGIWPSGDFRLSPGDGAAPALAYYAGAAFASILLLYGAFLCWRRRELALLAGLATGVGVFALARVTGTPYTTAKAIEIAAPVAALVILLPLLWRPVAALYLFLATGCSLLAFANAPIGPTDYSPALTGLRPAIADGPALFLGSNSLLFDEEGERYVAWELRGGRVCIEGVEEATHMPHGVRYVITEDADAGTGDANGGGGNGLEPPFPGLRLRRDAGPYLLWETTRPPQGPSPCPLIAVRQARQGPPR